MNLKLTSLVVVSLALAFSAHAQTWTLNGNNIYPTPNGGTQRTVSIGTNAVGTGQKLRVLGIAEFDTARATKRIVAYTSSNSSRLDPDRIVTRTATDSTEITPTSIKTKTVYVGTTGWAINAPDYVFKKDYNLMPLTEVKDYISRNGHLPGVPSAETMEKNGAVDLVEMNLTLLKKVEELTLHLINQESKIREQSNEIATMKNEMGK